MGTNKNCQNREDLFCRDYLEDNKGIEKLRKYFNKFFSEFADYCCSYHEHLGEFPFIYKERALTSVVLPSLINAGNEKTNEKTFVFMEQPFKKNDGTQRFLDFYVHHDNSLFLVEMKHSWNSPKTECITKNTGEKWTECIKQINDVKSSSIDSFVNKESYKNIFKVAMLIMPEYISSSKENNNFFNGEDNIQAHTNELEDYFKNYPQKQKPNFYATWKISEDPKFIQKYEEGRNEFYPFVSFCLRVEKIK